MSPLGLSLPHVSQGLGRFSGCVAPFTDKSSARFLRLLHWTLERSRGSEHAFCETSPACPSGEDILWLLVIVR